MPYRYTIFNGEVGISHGVRIPSKDDGGLVVDDPIDELQLPVASGHVKMEEITASGNRKRGSSAPENPSQAPEASIDSEPDGASGK